jgi:protein gp37
MNRTKIDWADYSWNPITGCLGPDGREPCSYCYAKRIAARFGADTYYFDGAYPDRPHLHYIRLDVEDEFIDLNFKDRNGYPMELGNLECRSLYPFNFEPTFHEYRLSEPQGVKKPSRVFVGSMGDTFGSWVPDEWIAKICDACDEAPQHQYLFLTKNPMRYRCLVPVFDKYLPLSLKWGARPNWWLGATFDTVGNTSTFCHHLGEIKARGYHSWASAEPLLEDIAPIMDWAAIDWLVIGALTGPGAKNRQPDFKWIESLTDGAILHGVPVFHKKSLASFYWPLPRLQQYPKAMMAQLDSKAT